MGFRNFKFALILRVVIIGLTIYLLSYLNLTDSYIVTQLLVGSLVVFQLISLINFLDKSNSEIDAFLKSIKSDDFTKDYELDTSHTSVGLLNQELNKIIQGFREIRAEKEAQYHYLKTIVQHVGIGIITFDNKGEIQIINTAAKKLLKISQINNIKQLDGISPELVESFSELKTGGRDLVKVEQSGESIQLAVYAIELTLSGEDFKLVSLQNIQTELEEKEMEAWQNLIRVLTHEIMNSVTPISSLAAIVEQELEQMAKTSDASGDSSDDLDDVHLAIKTIHRRSNGLIRFVSDFRNLTKIPTPKIEEHSVKDIFDQIVTLLKFELEKVNVSILLEVDPEDITINVDKELIEQVLINLIKNAIQALENEDDNDSRTIWFRAAREEDGQTLLTVKDNGPGIEEEAIPKIFIPFFTTKQTGSGIGLSLSKQIIRKHNGNLSVKSEINKGAEFIIKI